MTADPDNRPAKIEWAPCSCGHAACKRQHPTNLGMFYQGSGFEPHEVEWLDRAWAALAEREPTKDTA